MKILFVVGDVFLSEPHGVMILSAICKRHGHETKLLALKRASVTKALMEYKPDLIAYSAMTSEKKLFAVADQAAVRWMRGAGKPVRRIMGGPHPTFFPEVLNELELDAICIGEGDNAIVAIAQRCEAGEGFQGIPNVLPRGESVQNVRKELIADLDDSPFLDRDIFYEAAPIFRMIGLRSILTSRGCPYHCTYCHNHAFNKMFQSCGKIFRRRPPGRIIEEIKHTVANYPATKMIRFAADTFAHKVDDWLVELLTRYKKEIGLPFYCLMRSNTLSEEMAALLSGHGCISIGMSVESGKEELRNNVLKRHLTDEQVVRSFEIAHRHGLKTYGNTILAIPGGSYQDDFESFLFTKRLGMTVPTFTVFSPYPGTELTRYAVDHGWLDLDSNDLDKDCFETSPLSCFTNEEKNKQVNIAFLGTLFCDLPDRLLPLFDKIISFRPNIVFKVLGATYAIYKMGRHVFPGVYRYDPYFLFKLFLESIHFQIPRKEHTDS